MSKQDSAADTNKQLIERLRGLSPEQRNLLLGQLKQRGINIDEASIFSESLTSECTKTSRYPLTSSQLHVWLAQQKQPKSNAYHIAFRWDITGEINLNILQQAITKICMRHEALRLSFILEKGQTWQKINDKVTIEIQKYECHEEEINARLAEFVKKPFDLESAPLLRVCAIQSDSSKTNTTLAFIWHHLIADGASRGIFINELSQTYNALVSNQNHSIESDIHYYSDYLEAYQDWLTSPELEHHKHYWKNQLSECPTPSLPFRQTKVDETDFNSLMIDAEFPADLYQQINQLARDQKVTSFVILLAGFFMLLHRYGVGDDIAIGIPVAGRQLSFNNQTNDFNGLLGFFVNTLVIRVNPDSPDLIKHWIDDLKNTFSDAFEHQQLSLADTIELVGQGDLFSVMFQYQNLAYAKQNAVDLSDHFPGIDIKQDFIELQQTKFDLTLHAIERDQDLQLMIEYRTSAFKQEVIKNLAKHYVNLLQSWADISKQPTLDIPTHRLNYLQHDDLRCIQQWHRTKPDLESNRNVIAVNSIVEQFERITDDYPHLTAVAMQQKDEDIACLSYQELNQRANALALTLSKLDIEPESLVAICYPRSPELLVALLGVLKAGAAYLPIEPGLPDERIAFMLDDAQVATIILPDEFNSRFESLYLTDLNPSFIKITSAKEETNPSTAIQASQLAYCIYTSGSTGKPKGTLLNHAGLAHYMSWCLSTYPLEEGKGALVNSSIGFDATITGLFSPLLAAKTVTFLSDESGFDQLIHSLQRNHSLIKITPAHMLALEPLIKLHEKKYGTLDHTRLPKAFIIGGEALTEAHVEYWRKRFPSIQLINEYGPTETVVGCAYYEASDEDSGNIPIGTPIAGAYLYILDQYLQPLPAGIPGDLYIGGAAMARGYLNKSSLSAERFIPDPFLSDSNPGAVMYASGDRAVWREDGEMIFLGRSDQQLSLRGYRIEPGEIEFELSKDKTIKQAIVTIRNEILIAYVAFSTQPDDLEKWISKIQLECQKILPNYMVPKGFAVVENIPLTSNGKVDFQALSDVPLFSGEQDDKDLAVETDEERILLKIWQDVLDNQNISVLDNFFAVGGDSVRAMQIISRLYENDYQLEPSILFEHHTIRTQAPHIQPVEVLTYERPEGVCALSPIQWQFFERVKAGSQHNSHHYNLSIMLEIDDLTNRQTLQQALSYVVERNDCFRLQFSLDKEGEWGASYSDHDASILLEEYNTSDWNIDKYSKFIINIQNSLNIQDGILIKAALINSKNHPLRLLLVTHHLIMDGMSWRLIIDSLVNAYNALETKRELETRQTMPFSHWTSALKENISLFDKESDYWMNLVTSESTRALIGNTLSDTDKGTVYKNLGSYQQHIIKIDQNLSQRIIKWSQSISVEALLLSIVAKTLADWSNKSCFQIMLEHHGRTLYKNSIPNPLMTLGWFTSAFPIQINLTQDPLEQQVIRIEESLKKIPNHGLGFGVLQMNKRLPSYKQPDVLFNYLGNIDIEGKGFIKQFISNEDLHQVDPESKLEYPIKIISMIQHNCLEIVLLTDPTIIDANSVELMSNIIKQRLEAFIDKTDIELKSPQSIPDTKSSIADQKNISKSAAEDLLNRLNA